MKVSIALIVILFLSAISADPGPMTQVMIKLFESVMQGSQREILFWDDSASLQENVVTQVKIILKSGPIPGSESDVSLKDKVVDEIDHTFASLADYDSRKTVTENLNVLVTGFTNMLFVIFSDPAIENYAPKDQMRQLIIENVLNSLKVIKVSGFDVQKSLDEATLVVVKAVLDGYRAECTTSLPTDECITAGTVNALNLLGFNPKATLDENVSETLRKIFDLPF